MTAVPPRPAAPAHNHVTRDVKSRGKCPACDECWDYMTSGALPAPDATAGDELREAIAECAAQIAEDDGLFDPERVNNPALQRETLRAGVASAVLALPALRDVLAAAARDAEKVRRVEALVDEWVAFTPTSSILRDAGRVLRRALDGAT